MPERPAVLVVTSEDWYGLARLPRFLAAAGCRVDALARPEAPLSSSSLLGERIDAVPSPAETLELLRRRLETRRYDWVILGDDAVLSEAARRCTEPWLAGVLPTKKSGEAIEALISKTAYSRAMAACGVPMAPGRGARTIDEVGAAAAALGFPVIVKPDRGWAGGGVFAAASAADLALQASKLRGDSIVEKLLEGRLGGTAVLFDSGRPAWWASYLMSGIWPPPYGASCRRIPHEPAGLELILEKMGGALGLHGLMGLDWMEAPDGGLFIIELNGRPVQVLEPDAVAGALPAALRDFLAGTRSTRRPRPVPPGIVCHILPESFALAWRERDRGLAARLLLGLAGPTNTPWRDAGLLLRHSLRLARSVAATLLGRDV